MWIAVTSMDKALDSPVARRFGRAEFIFVADTETRVVKIIDNRSFAALVLGSGTKTAEMLANLGVAWVATGEIGRDSFRILAGGGIKVVTSATGTCREILDRLVLGDLTPASGPSDCTGFAVPPTE